MTCQALAHVEPVTVSRWERGENTPDLGKLELIAAATDRPLTHFVGEPPSVPSDVDSLAGAVDDLAAQFGEWRTEERARLERIERLLAKRPPVRKRA